METPFEPRDVELAELLFPDVIKSISEYEIKYPPRKVENGARITRFAPSPTGFVHIGGIYAAMVSRLLAHQTMGGSFFLRIEDTDKAREVKDGTNEIINSLRNFHIYPDEGYVETDKVVGQYGPYKQSNRIEIYRTFAKYLVKRGLAYPCFCTSEELEDSRKIQEAKKVRPGYYGEWAKHRNSSLDEIKKRFIISRSFALRIKSESKIGESIHFHDLIKGDLEFPPNDMDVVILKSDNLPTYHFAHVVDDYLMRVTDVIRGDEWLSSLPIHLQLFRMFGITPPNYGHIAPIVKIIGKSKRKLSKRKDPEAAVSFYYERGYPAESVLEYLLNLANSNFSDWRGDNISSSINDFPFDISKMSNSWSTFDIDKLNYTSKNLIARMSSTDIYEDSLEWFSANDPDFTEIFKKNKGYVQEVLNIENTEGQNRKDISCWVEIKDKFGYFFDEMFDGNVISKIFPEEMSASEISQIFKYFIENYNEKETNDIWLEKSKKFLIERGYSPDSKSYKLNKEKYLGQIGMPFMALRVALTGQTKTPDLYEIMKIMGKERVETRLQKHILEEDVNSDSSYGISPELRSVAQSTSCLFLDYRTTSKDHVRESLESNKSKGVEPKSEIFTISTCLRYETYSFNKIPKADTNFHMIVGKLAIRRLLSLLSGLQSEIIGEQEITAQIKHAIDYALSKNEISISTYKAMTNLISISKKIRTNYYLNTEENYSTIGADMLEDKIDWEKNPIVMIIGGGYMANAFLKKISSKVKKLIWVNRSLAKLRTQSLLFKDIPTESIIFSSPEECFQYFPMVDIIFSAVSNAPFKFGPDAISKLGAGCQIIDVSYPPIFVESKGINISNISNTYFDKLSKKVIPKHNISLANKKIDDLIQEIFSNGE